MSIETVLKVRELSVSYNEKKVFENISFTVKKGQIVGIIGPNGAGKSTLLKAMLGFMPVNKGTVEYNEEPILKMRNKIAYVPQRSTIDMDFPVLVEDVVMMGRFPHISWCGFPTKKDRKIVVESLRQVGMDDVRHRQIGQLSGGQQQRVFLARALAQCADLFFLDEPFAGIDMSSEGMIMEILQKLRNAGKILFVVHHDLSKADMYFDNLLLLKNKLIAFGKSDEVFKPDRLREAYDGKIATFTSQNDLLVVNG